MKRLIFLTIASFLVSYGVCAGGLFGTGSESPGKIFLLDGRSIDLERDVESIRFYDGRIDYIELFGGEIIDRMDIDPLPLDGHIHFRSGGVGGGG